jgi:hypothetical protein
MSGEPQRTCPSCGNEFSGAMEFCPVCALRSALADGVESGESSACADTTKPTRPQQSVQRFQHYELVKGEDGKPLELGRGAMGVTDKAFDIDLRCTVTLKGVWGYSSAVLDLVILILYTHFRRCQLLDLKCHYHTVTFHKDVMKKSRRNSLLWLWNESTVTLPAEEPETNGIDVSTTSETCGTPDVTETPLHSLETDSSVKLASSRGKPVESLSGIGLNEREGIAVRRKVSIKIYRFARRDQTQRHATIFIDREGAIEQEPTDDCTSE